MRAGATLVELTIVMLIVAVSAALVAPVIPGGFAKLEVAPLDSFLAILDSARVQSAECGCNVRVRAVRDSVFVEMWHRRTPRITSRTGNWFAAKPALLMWLPNGRAAGVLEVVHAGTRTTVVVDTWTGRASAH